MSTKKSRSVFAVLLSITMLCGTLYWPRATRACGPFFPAAIFAYSKHPDVPLKPFAGGELGVLQPTYARSYLVVAYRYLTAAPLDTGEQKAVTSLWQERLNLGPSQEDDKSPYSWADTRARVTGAGPAPEIRDVFRPVSDKESYQQYLNCPDDAFHTAAATLSKRIERFGADSPEVRDWVQAQDQVFANCAGGKSVPALAKSGFPAVIQADRAYQLAAANFYAGNFEVAERMFNDIAADSASPWSHIAPYLEARTLVRKATLTAGPGKSDLTVLGEAESRLIKILADPRTGDLRPAAVRLLNYVRFRHHPEERLHELAEAVLKKNSGSTLKQDLWDLTMLMDDFRRDNYEELPAVLKRDDVSDWIFTFQAWGKAALDHSLQKWNQTRSLPWLIAAISKTGGADAAASGLISAGANIRQGSPGFASVAFHSVRLLMRNRRDEARTRLEAVFARGGPALPHSARNLFLSERMLLARSLDDFLRYAARVPAGISTDNDGNEMPDEDTSGGKDSAADRPIFGVDATNIMNEGIPAAMLARAASSTVLPTHLRRELALATWVRAAMLDDVELAAQLTPTVAAQFPDLKRDLDSYSRANGIEAKRFAAVFLMLEFPGTRPYLVAGIGRTTELNKIDDYRDNWWCALNNAARLNLPNFYRLEEEGARTSKPGGPDVRSPDFLTETEKAQAASEWKKLSAIPTAPDYLPAQTVDWVNKNPEEARAAESLYLAVRSTRYGCTDKDTLKFSKAAFDLLHKRYPNSDWAKKTKYYYGK